MSQERLNDLVMVSIEKNLTGKLNYESLMISTFVAKNVGRAVFE